MKILYSLILCMLFTPTSSIVSPTHQITPEEEFNRSPFHEQAFLTLLEEFQDYTKHKPKSPKEDPVISDFMQRLATQTSNIEVEITNTKLGIAERTQKSLSRLKHYNSAAKTALKELQKRQGQVQFLKESSSMLDQEINLAQQQKPILTAYNNLRSCLLHSPMLMSC
jgi:hypothetical protein